LTHHLPRLVPRLAKEAYNYRHSPVRFYPLIRGLGPPIIVFLLARAVLILAAACAHQDGWSALSYVRADSVNYLSIAENGYVFFPCNSDPRGFCGNAGWLPGFPLLIRFFTAMHLPPVASGAWIAGGFALATLILLWNVFLGAEVSTSGLLSLALAAFFPGHVYYHAIFPVSMCNFFQLLAIWAHVNRRFVWAGLAGTIASFSYSPGVFLAGVFALDSFWHDPEQPLVRRIRQGALAAGLVAAGFLAFLVMLGLETGVWRAYFLVHATDQLGLHMPWTVLASHLRKAVRPSREYPTPIALIIVCCFVWAAWRSPRKRFDRVLMIFCVTYWLVPLCLGGAIALYREEAMLLPSVALSTKLPITVLVFLLLLSLLAVSGIDFAFFKGLLA
jgi:hypothetical protein